MYPVGREELVSGVDAVMERIRQDAINGEFDSALYETGLPVTGVVDMRKREPVFMCPEGSVLQNQACGRSPCSHDHTRIF
jgi:hypothetical protein